MKEHSGLAVIQSKEELSDSPFLRTWERLVAGSGTPYGMYASPDWVLHTLEVSGGPVRVWKVLDATGGLRGMVPLNIATYRLSFEAANRRFLTVPLKAVHVLGGVPALPGDREDHLRFFDGVLRGVPECEGVYFDMIPENHWFTDLLRGDQQIRKRYVVHSPFGTRRWHLLRIQGSFDEYLGRLGSKSRYSLRKNVRRLEGLGRPLRLERVDRPEQVPPFLRTAVEVSKNSWQHRELGERISDGERARRSMTDLARRGLLRAYLLFSGEKALAFSMAHQYQGVVNSYEMGFHQEFARYSPGKVLLYLIIRDLHADGNVTLLNLGMGDAEYKRWFSDIERSESSWLLMRASVRNRLLAGSHAGFDGAVRLVKRVMGR